MTGRAPLVGNLTKVPRTPFSSPRLEGGRSATRCFFYHRYIQTVRTSLPTKYKRVEERDFCQAQDLGRGYRLQKTRIHGPKGVSNPTTTCGANWGTLWNYCSRISSTTCQKKKSPIRRFLVCINFHSAHGSLCLTMKKYSLQTRNIIQLHRIYIQPFSGLCNVLKWAEAY